MSTIERCDQCVYWKHDPAPWDTHSDDFEGGCHRYPPLFNRVYLQTEIETQKEPFDSLPGSNFWTHSVTSATDWCGEFKENGK